MPATVTVHETPNPNARRFVVDRPLQEESRGRFYTDVQSAEHPLARALLALEGVTGVMVLPASVTVNKVAGATWEQLVPRVQETFEQYFG